MTQKWTESGQLQVLGVVQEQHAERTRLYAQWRQFDWPILQDAFCEMGIKAVPMAIAIDEMGNVAAHRVNEKWLADWIEGGDQSSQVSKDSVGETDDPFEQLVQAGDQAVKFPNKDSDINQAIDDYEKALSIRATAPAHFRLGVAYRKRFDLFGDENDFLLAERHWSKSLEIDPNQYIFRRRIEQYGPRLMKPYPFYDWVETAVSEIVSRGETPVELKVPLSGAEIAGRVKDFGGVTGEVASPDPGRKINQDNELVEITTIVVPGRIAKGLSGRVHVALEPADSAKWNNESSETMVWIEPPEGVEVTHRLIKLQQPKDVTSSERRATELEIKLAKDYSGPNKIPGFALYNVCKNDDGVCLYLRNDFEIDFEIAEK